MVKSKLDDTIIYKEFKYISQTDKNTSVSLYQILLFDTNVVIALGKINSEYINKGVLYCPVYIVLNDSSKIEKIGVYELNANDYTNVLDDDGDLDITVLDGPLLFNFVNESYIKEFMNDVEIIQDTDDDDDDDDEIVNEKIVKKDFETEQDDDEVHKSETKKDDNKIRENYVKQEKEPWIKTWLKNNYYKIHDKGADGDCFFLCVAAAFNSINIDMSVSKLRSMISDNLDQNQFKTYKELYEGTINELTQNEKKIEILKKENLEISKKHKEKVVNEKKEKDKPTQKIMLKEIKELSTKHKKNKVSIKNLLNESKYANENVNEFSFMKGINNLNKLKNLIKKEKSAFWADSYAIQKLEILLNTKFIILSNKLYEQGKYDEVIQCPDMVPDIVEKNKIFNPKYYILLDYVGNIHYRVVEYKDKLMLRFHDIPYSIKNGIVERCMKGRGKSIYNYIPKFSKIIGEIIEIKKDEEKEEKDEEKEEKDEEKEEKDEEKEEKDEKEKTEEEEVTETTETPPTKDDSDEKLYDDNIVFVFNSKSRDAKPGKGVGETITLEANKEFQELNKINNWRKMLSNFYVSPFELDGKKWNSVEHYFHSQKFIKNNPDFSNLFSLDSKSEICEDPLLAKGAGGKTGKIRVSSKPARYKVFRSKKIVMDDGFYDGVGEKAMEKAQDAKYSQNKDLENMLILTKNAKLVHSERKRGQKSNMVTFYDTMRIREKLKNKST